MKNILEKTAEKLHENLFSEEEAFEFTKIKALTLNNKIFNAFLECEFSNNFEG